MSSNFDRLMPLADQLNRTYHKALDRLENQVNETVVINQDVRAILEQDKLDVLPVITDSSASPREVYVAFCQALASKALPMLSASPNKNGYRVTDLVDWSDIPPRGHLSDKDFHLTKITHARSKSMREFLQALVIRFNPTALPEASLDKAIHELINVFSVHTAIGIAIPIRREQGPGILRCPLQRTADEAMWHLANGHQRDITRASNAIATIALLNEQPAIAASLDDMLTILDIRMTQQISRYEAGQTFHAGPFLKLTLQRDGADFHLGNNIFELLKTTLSANVSDIQLVFH